MDSLQIVSLKHPSGHLPMNDFTPAAIASDVSWVPDMAALDALPVTAESFVQAYLADPSTWHWSTDMLNVPREIVLKRVLAIIAQARLPNHQQALGQLGAGPLEDLMSDALLDDLRPWMPFNAEMRYALGNVRMNVEPPTLRHRLEEMLLCR
jgi:hypothetical protein